MLIETDHTSRGSRRKVAEWLWVFAQESTRRKKTESHGNGVAGSGAKLDPESPHEVGSAGAFAAHFIDLQSEDVSEVRFADEWSEFHH